MGQSIARYRGLFHLSACLFVCLLVCLLLRQENTIETKFILINIFIERTHVLGRPCFYFFWLKNLVLLSQYLKQNQYENGI